MTTYFSGGWVDNPTLQATRLPRHDCADSLRSYPNSIRSYGTPYEERIGTSDHAMTIVGDGSLVALFDLDGTE